MRTKCWIFLTCATFALLAAASAQDAPSLGDLARQQRQQKSQPKSTPAKDAKTAKVITNEELPSHTESAPSTGNTEVSMVSAPEAPGGAKLPTEQVKSQILAQKSQIASLQQQMDQMNESIRFAPANCVANCVQWNERQRQKQQQVERMQAQLEESKRRLEEMQESARKQGFGSSVYEP